MAQLFETDTPKPRPTGYAHVALEQGIDAGSGGLTYGIPPALADLAVGQRVRVPLGRGNRPTAGYVVGLSDETDVDPKHLKMVLDRDRQRVTLPADLIALAKWIASYYCAPLGMVFATMLPAAVKKGTGTVDRTEVSLAQAPLPEVKLSKLQTAVIEAAKTRADAGHAWTDPKLLADLAGARSVSPVKQLIEKAMLQTRTVQAVVSDLDLRAQKAAEAVSKLTLSPGQTKTLSHLTEHMNEGFGVHLIHGVTGSGKTEVYLRIIESLLADEPAAGLPTNAPPPNPQASPLKSQASPRPGIIVLVPEIALTPQTVARFIARFDGVAVLHSGLTASQRHVQWRRISSGEANIVVGARSAIFAPLASPKLIIVDEEHEHSYKQDQVPRYHGRDVAIKRAQLLNIPIILGSATPSLESYYNATKSVSSSELRVSSASGNSEPETRNPKLKSVFHLLHMPDRAPGMKLPHVELVDLQEERRSRRGIHLLSQRLEHELHRVLEPTDGQQPGQALLLLNRRGYANYIACPDHNCGWMMTCNLCDVTMVYHRDHKLPTGGVVRCHHCGTEQLLPKLCPTCKKRVTVFGLGTQRVEEELANKFPNARILRMDSDTMRTGKDYQQALDRFRAGDIDVLLGTQMIAKGLDFPRVRLVGVIAADTSLNMPDFRAEERTFQLIAQVAGRAGRSDKPGKVVVQTFNPDSPAILDAANHDYEAFAKRELETRAMAHQPPVSRMARIVVRDGDLTACVERARTLADHLHQYNEQLQAGVRIQGPVECSIARIAGFHRQEIQLFSSTAGKLQQLLTALRNSRLLVSDNQTAVDVDPVSLM